MIIIANFQFKDFVFPNNPEKISVSFDSNLVTQYYPFKGEQACSLGKKLKRVVCKGVFWGKNNAEALRVLSSFLSATSSPEVGMLFVPGYTPFNGFLKEYAVDFIDDGCIIPYTLVFLEKGDVY